MLDKSIVDLTLFIMLIIILYANAKLLKRLANATIAKTALECFPGLQITIRSLSRTLRQPSWRIDVEGYQSKLSWFHTSLKETIRLVSPLEIPRAYVNALRRLELQAQCFVKAVLVDDEMSGCVGALEGMKERWDWSNGQSLYGRAMILCR